MQKKILIPGGKLADLSLVNAAHRMGFYVITSGTDKNAPAHSYADKYICADYSDKEAMLRIAKEENIDFMCSCANDFGMISTSYVCEQLGLPGHDSYETTLTIHNKDRFCEVAEELKLRTPKAKMFDSYEAAITFLQDSEKRMIVKPVDNVASIGVTAPITAEEKETAVRLAFEKSKNKKILIEEYIEGTYVPLSVMVVNHKVKSVYSEDVYIYHEGDRIGPDFPVSARCTGWVMPSLNFSEVTAVIKEDFDKLIERLDLVDGKIHCETMVTANGEVYIFDIHRRMSGYFSPWADWDVYNTITWTDWILKAECGMDISEFPEMQEGTRFIHARNIFAPQNGILKRVVLDKYLSSHLYPIPYDGEYTMSWLVVTDYLHEPISKNFPADGSHRLMFMFDNLDEAKRMCDPESHEFYDHISFVYSDSIVD